MSLINYTYLTTNLITGEQYVGDHTINPLDKKYYQGSGKYLARAIKKYRSENFFKEILEWFPTKQEAFDAQEKYIIYFNTLTPNGYNISPKGGHQCKESVSSETKQKIGKSNKDKKRTLEQIKNISNGHLNLHHSEGTKQKIS